MSHLVETMAYTGQTPWHQLGHALPKKQSIDVWAEAAGMQWKIQETPVRYMATGDADALYGEALEFPEQKVLYRSCWRRFKIEPPCRLNFEPGLMANL